ncbi:MAG TPA: hypothetical protein VL651_00690 [Bacteroidia bacterium]|jgi:hypothetical protein|nr:hypothetical protein [Bacteroidia bacterium]
MRKRLTKRIRAFFSLLMLFIGASQLHAQDTTQYVYHKRFSDHFVFVGDGPSNGYFKNIFILGPEISLSENLEIYAGLGVHLDWITTKPGYHDGHWIYWDHIFTYRWNWHMDKPYFWSEDLEYDMFRSYSGFGARHWKIIGGIVFSHLTDFGDYNSFLFTPMVGITHLGLFDLKAGYTLPISQWNDEFYARNVFVLSLTWRPFLKWHQPVL